MVRRFPGGIIVGQDTADTLGLTTLQQVTTLVAGRLTQAAADLLYRAHNQAPRTASAGASVSIDGSLVGDFDLTCTGDTVITPTGTPNGRTLVITALASGGARNPSIHSSIPMSEGVASRTLAVPSGGKGRFVLRYSSLGTAGWSLDSAFLVG